MFDIVIIGAGVIGLSIARAIGEQTNKSVLVIEKDDSFGKGISSRRRHTRLPLVSWARRCV